MTTIVRTTDWRALLAGCHADDLRQWHPDFVDLDWDTMLAQPGWHLITDGCGSWTLLEPVGDASMGHVIIARDRRGKQGLQIGRAMLKYIATLGTERLTATPKSKAAAVFLSWLGFDSDDVDLHTMSVALGHNEV